MKQRRQRPGEHTERRIPAHFYVTGHIGWTHGFSPRQLPTDHDHDGGLVPIREYQSDQPSHQLSLAVVYVASPASEKSLITHLTGRSISEVRVITNRLVETDESAAVALTQYAHQGREPDAGVLRSIGT